MTNIQDGWKTVDYNGSNWDVFQEKYAQGYQIYREDNNEPGLQPGKDSQITDIKSFVKELRNKAAQTQTTTVVGYIVDPRSRTIFTIKLSRVQLDPIIEQDNLVSDFKKLEEDLNINRNDPLRSAYIKSLQSPYTENRRDFDTENITRITRTLRSLTDSSLAGKNPAMIKAYQQRVENRLLALKIFYLRSSMNDHRVPDRTKNIDQAKDHYATVLEDFIRYCQSNPDESKANAAQKFLEITPHKY